MSRSDDIQKARDYYNGVVKVHYDGFLARYKGADVATPIPQTSFIMANEIKSILNKRASLVPSQGITFGVFTNEGEKIEDKTDWLTDWLTSPNFGSGVTFEDFSTDIPRVLEVDGGRALKLYMDALAPKVQSMSALGLDIITDELNVGNVIEYKSTQAFVTTDAEGADKEVEVIDSVTETDYAVTVDGQPVGDRTEPHNLGFLPVAYLKRLDPLGTQYGPSAAPDFYAVQDDINRTATNVGKANKFAALGLYCKNESDGTSPDGNISLAEGSLIPFPVTKLSNEGAGAAISDEKANFVEQAYRIAGISPDTNKDLKTSDTQSGKALVVLTAQGKRYISGLIARLKRGYAEMASMALVMAGEFTSMDDFKVEVSFPDLNREDPATVMARAQFLAGEGLTIDALMVLGWTESEAIAMIARADNNPPTKTGTFSSNVADDEDDGANEDDEPDDE
jgi:hypothetical protein